MPGGGRVAYVVAAAGLELVAWWLFLASRTVDVVEAYTLPFAAVALVAGWFARRTRPVLGSWQAYGPALAAAFLPSLAPILATEGDPVRRLVLGAAALAVVVTGAVRRLQAPVVLGGLVLAVVAVHELVLLGQQLPSWVPLSVGGALLLGGRRDLRTPAPGRGPPARRHRPPRLTRLPTDVPLDWARPRRAGWREPQLPLATVTSATNRSGSITARWNRPKKIRIRKSTRRVAMIAGITRSRLIASDGEQEQQQVRRRGSSPPSRRTSTPSSPAGTAAAR